MTAMPHTSQGPAPIAPGLFVDETAQGRDVRLRGARDTASGRIVFPYPDTAEGYQPITLAAEGMLWSFTVQRFRPKTPPYAGPEAFKPYAVGYVELPGEVIVETRLTGVAFDALRIGLPMRLTTEIILIDGEPRTGFAFSPREA
jgi:uncharacterized OB-fold protein